MTLAWVTALVLATQAPLDASPAESPAATVSAHPETAPASATDADDLGDLDTRPLLVVSLPPPCPTSQALRRGVAARMGKDPFQPPRTPEPGLDDAERASAALVVTGVASADGQLTISVVSRAVGEPSGERTLQGSLAGCAELAAQTELVLTLMLDPLASTAAPVAPLVEVVPALEPAAAPPAQHRRPHPKLSAPTASGFGAGGVGVVLGRQPILGLGAHATFGAHVPLRWTLVDALELGAELEVTAPVPANIAGGTAQGTQALLALLPCARSGIAVACLRGDVGALIAWGGGFTGARGGAQPSSALGARIGVVLPLAPRLGLCLSAEALVPLVHHTLGLEGQSAVFETWPIAPGLVAQVRTDFVDDTGRDPRTLDDTKDQGVQPR